ncbi:MAG: rRNA maturation RNase YbeY [Candidatus Erginobacter occultus]|nr:rRNA maturation RNase YbeY [Candidatus Erginobacter occultus]
MPPIIQITDRQRRIPLDREGIAALAAWVLIREGRREGELSLLFTNDPRIRKLNREYLARDRPTDVLAFPQDGAGPLLGDVVISTERVVRQAPEYRQSVHDELALCLIHGILHLTGWRDHPAAAREEMGKREKALLRSWRRKKLWSLTK